MFYVEERVRSPHYGLGVVVRSGKNPWMRLLGGGELPVDGRTLHVVPDEVYDAEVENRAKIERYLTLRICGSLPPHADSLPRPSFDLEAAMQATALFSPCVQSPPLGASILLFDADDFRGPDTPENGGTPLQHQTVRVVATRIDRPTGL